MAERTSPVEAQTQEERERFEQALSEKPEARLWNTTDAMFWAWQARAVLAAAAVPQWMPIETMPKDGREVLTTDGKYFEVLNQPPGCDLGVWAELRPGTGVWSGSCVRHTDPTHWTHLPPPPGQLPKQMKETSK